MSKAHGTTAVPFALAVLLVGSCATGVQTARPGAEAELIALDDAWINAEVQRDRAALERILDERFLATFASGRTIDRMAFIDLIMEADIQPFEVLHEVIQIHGDVALVIDSSRVRGTKYTWIAVRKQGQWRVISETFTNIETSR